MNTQEQHEGHVAYEVATVRPVTVHEAWCEFCGWSRQHGTLDEAKAEARTHVHRITSAERLVPEPGGHLPPHQVHATDCALRHDHHGDCDSMGAAPCAPGRTPEGQTVCLQHGTWACDVHAKADVE